MIEATLYTPHPSNPRILIRPKKKKKREPFKWQCFFFVCVFDFSSSDDPKKSPPQEPPPPRLLLVGCRVAPTPGRIEAFCWRRWRAGKFSRPRAPGLCLGPKPKPKPKPKPQAKGTIPILLVPQQLAPFRPLTPVLVGREGSPTK